MGKTIFEWVPTDKQLHFLWGFMLSSLGVTWTPLFALGFLANVVKEAWDHTQGTFDIYDLVAGCLGSLVAVLLLFP